MRSPIQAKNKATKEQGEWGGGEQNLKKEGRG